MDGDALDEVGYGRIAELFVTADNVVGRFLQPGSSSSMGLAG